MLCTVSCFDRVMNLVKELPTEKLREALEVTTEYSFSDFLDFCVENKCFTEEQASTLYDGIVMWEDLEGNYWEENHDKLMDLYDRVGLTADVVREILV